MVEIIGISLQLFAGFIFLLDRISQDWPRVNTWLRSQVRVSIGSGRIRRLAAFIIAVIALLAVIPVSIILTEKDEAMTIPYIWGLVFTATIFAYPYLYFLDYLTESIQKWKITRRLHPAHKSLWLLYSNMFLLISSIIVLTLLFLSFQVDLKLNTWLPLVYLVTIFRFLILVIAAPVLIGSVFFLVPLGILELSNYISRQSRKRVLLAVLLVWLSGGGLILYAALSQL